ncbi:MULTISPECIES: helix-turn-helix domain-containing protein [unclassified Nocardiopsis]|uniref:helix-turn-helix domain-containing protein n=1 Tax=Nocardiopsis TaxID=2013 RepID=UPI00387B24C6
MDSRGDWRGVVAVIEQLVADDRLLSATVAGVRGSVREVAALTPGDMSAHTRALLLAATRAVAARRGPTEAELGFVQELGVTRAIQGIPVEAVLSAIHVAERAIWARAREIARSHGVGAEQLLDMRELYEDWAEAVRGRLITAHRETLADQERSVTARDTALLLRLLEGGTAASLAAAEAGLPAELWVVTARSGEPADTARWERDLRDLGPALAAEVDGLFVAVLARAPAPGTLPGPAGLAGPGHPERLSGLRRLAASALTAAEATGRTGVVHIADVAALAAVVERDDLAEVLGVHHAPARRALGSNAVPVAQAVRVWFECDRDVAWTAEALFVHPNTVRNRLQRFAEVTGMDPYTPLGAVDAWWLCRTWLLTSE